MRKTIFVVTLAGLLSLAGAGGAATARLPNPASEVEARVDRTRLGTGETLQLTLRVRGRAQAPDLEPLDADFDVLDVARSHRTTIVNGRRDESIDWRLTLAPKRAGTLEIPSLGGGAARSEPIAIRVVEGTSASRDRGSLDEAGAAAPVFVEAEVDDASPYVQGKVLLTVRLYADERVIDGQLADPEAPGAVVERLGDDRVTRSAIDGRSYRVVERQFALFPQRSGELTVEPIVFDGHLRDTRRRRARDPFDSFADFDELFGGARLGGGSLFDAWLAGSGLGGGLLDGFFGPPGRRVRTRSEPLTLAVSPRPEQADGEWWLPARGVELVEDWEGDPPLLRVGEPVTRLVAIRATGVSGAQLPVLDLPEVEGLKQYPEPPLDDTVAQGDEVVSVKLQRVTLIPTRPGSLTLPELELSWWDTTRDEPRVARLPARRVDVLPAEGAEGAEGQAAAALLPAPPTPNGGERPSPAPEAPGSRLGRRMLSGIGALCLLPAALLVRRRAGERGTGTGLSHPSPELRRAERALRSACAAGDAAAAQVALQQVGRARWPESPPLNPAIWARRLRSARLREAIDALLLALYAPEPEAWDGRALWEAYRLASRRRRSSRAGDAPSLPPLYPAE